MVSYSDSEFPPLALVGYFWKERLFLKEVFFFVNPMCFIWLRCSCQASKTSSYIYKKIMIELHITMEMPRDMEWGKIEDFRNLSLVGETYRHRKQQSRHWKTIAVKIKGEANDMADLKQPCPEDHMAFLPGNQEPVPRFLGCFWISVCSKETISFNFLINVCPCWQTLWMGYFSLPIMAVTLDLITVEMNQETWLQALHFKCQQSNNVASLF